MKSLVLAEKPSVARDIARVLKCGKSLNGAMEGQEYIVTWGLGHLVTLADPEDYHPRYKEWKMEDLPMLPDEFKLEVIKQTGKQYNAVKTQLYRNDVKDIIMATDAGREGELVARLILKKAGSRKPIRRLWISSVTDKAIREGFAHLKDGREYDNLYDAAMCRAEADWMVGINATRALTCKYNAQISCGLYNAYPGVIETEEEIDNSSPGHISITGESRQPSNFPGRTEGQTPLFVERIEAGSGLQGKQGVVEDVSTPKTYAPLLYDLTGLRVPITVRLLGKGSFEHHAAPVRKAKVLTYPRTDSRYLSADIVPTLKESLRACGTGPYKKLAGRLTGRPLPEKLFFVDNGRVSDHHAIIPTEQFVQLDHMTVDERRIYDLVVRRFLAVLYPPFEYEQTALTVKAGNECFTARGEIVKASGWREAYENEREEEEDAEGEEQDVKAQKLPDIKKGDILSSITFRMTEGKTKPPSPFNEATLLSAMENPAAYMESKDREMAKTLGETGGLGTVATRADIIEKLFSSFLLEKRGKEIFLTSKAKQLLNLVPEDLKKPELTAQWEMKLSKIAKGNLKRDAFMKDIREYSGELISQIKAGEGSFRHDNLTNTKCPVCGKRMLLVKGKNSEILVCQDRECGHRETIARTSNARCPVCHKKLELRGKGESQIFVCRCGYKEILKALEREERGRRGVQKRRRKIFEPAEERGRGTD
ncbi:MAG: DNA topoisomerase III [[Clostridium] symbiosum]